MNLLKIKIKTLSAPFTKMTEALDYVFDEGPKVGYHLKRTKGVYLLRRCEDLFFFYLDLV